MHEGHNQTSADDHYGAHPRSRGYQSTEAARLAYRKRRPTIATPGRQGHAVRRCGRADGLTLMVCRASWRLLVRLGARGQLHLKRRSFARRRLHPDAAAMHLHDLLGDGEAKAGTALGFGKRTVDLVELIEYAGLLLLRDPWPRVRHGDGEMTVDRLRRDAYLAGVGELDGVADEVEEHLGEALLVAKPDGQGLRNLGLERELLVLSERLGG